jgi:acetyl/propionyl-CoA carboxylase alpha subunit
LPFFREIVEDEEFIKGNLDTGFIERFNARKKEREVDEAARDLAIIAVVLANGGNRKTDSNESDKTPPAASRWALAGRAAAHQNRM